MILPDCLRMFYTRTVKEKIEATEADLTDLVHKMVRGDTDQAWKDTKEATLMGRGCNQARQRGHI